MDKPDEGSDRHARLAVFGANVRRLRLLAGLSQEDLAASAGLHRVTIGLLESAKREVGVSAVVPLAHALDSDVDELFRSHNG